MKPGQAAEATAVIGQQTDKIKSLSSFAFVQISQSGDDFLVVSAWKTEKDVRAHADSALAHEMLKRLSSLFGEGPTIRNFAIELMVESQKGFFAPDEGVKKEVCGSGLRVRLERLTEGT